LEERRLIHSEQIVLFPLENTSFLKYWCVKADMEYEDSEGHWIGDLKTTSGYGAATARYYRSSFQTKTYYHVLKTLKPSIRGTKIYVVTKQKVRCEVESVDLTKHDQYQAALFMRAALEEIERAEKERHFPREGTACENIFGGLCPYLPLCMDPRVYNNPKYVEELVNDWFAQRDPDEHLELDKCTS